jgi:cytochrome c oxidase subunit III
MTTQTGSISEYRYKEGNSRLGLWLFILSDSFVFAGLLVSRFYLLGFKYHPEANQFLGLAITIMLLLSSFFMYRAETSMAFGDQRGFVRNALVTMVLGSLFLIGVVGVEWQLAPAGPNAGAVWSLFYTLTGFHAFHVLTGLILLFIVWRKARMGKYSVERHWGVEAAAVYWHFIDVVWFFIYPALYLIGRPLI